MGELCEVEAKLMEGSARAEEGCGSGFTAAVSLPGFGRSDGGVPWSGSGKWRKDEGNGSRAFL